MIHSLHVQVTSFCEIEEQGKKGQPSRVDLEVNHRL